jgi:TM2 domain-containing membrane protein YozV
MSDPAWSTPGPALSSRDAQAMMRYDANKKSLLIAYVLWFFFSGLGAHRFYLRRTRTAVAMLVIFLLSFALAFVAIGYVGFAIVGIWALVDIFLIPGMVRDYNNGLITQLTA